MSEFFWVIISLVAGLFIVGCTVLMGLVVTDSDYPKGDRGICALMLLAIWLSVSFWFYTA